MYSEVTVVGYGHLADGNVHINVICPDHHVHQQIQHLLEPWLFH